MSECVFCGDELWSHRERGGVCCSCQGLPLDDAGDDDFDTSSNDDFCDGDTFTAPSEGAKRCAPAS